ncbi:MAG: GMP synthase subunit A [Euryarchaeota archaeon]|nr:GMP synthase subunit A [Euryarchaeota archaeon]
MKVFVVDNGGQWTHREWRVLRDLGVEAKIVPNDTPLAEFKDVDAVVLSGGAPSIFYEKDKLGLQEEYLDELQLPILGICVGAQLIAEHFSGRCGPADVPEYGKTRIEILNHDELFEGIPDTIIVWESHNDEIKDTGVMKNLASSKNCKNQAVKHPTLPIYGVQFHPEVEHTEFGDRIFENFLKLIKR